MIAPVLERLKAAAAERELKRELPYGENTELAKRRLLWLGVPREDGGAGASVRGLFVNWFTATATDDDGEVVSVTVPTGGATDCEHNFDRHWRNARTVANHNPRNWKAGVIGGYRLVGEEPPTSGLL